MWRGSALNKIDFYKGRVGGKKLGWKNEELFLLSTLIIWYLLFYIIPMNYRLNIDLLPNQSMFSSSLQIFLDVIQVLRVFVQNIFLMPEQRDRRSAEYIR